MPNTALTDDYVAEILKRDAQKKNANAFIASGWGSLLSRPRGKAPKPNTRFLKNIVRDADAHNAALRKKEQEDSRARLKGLRGERDHGRGKERSRSRDRKRREDSDEDEDRRRSKRRRTHSDKDRPRSRDRRKRRSLSRSKSPRRLSSPSRRSRDDRERRRAEETLPRHKRTGDRERDTSTSDGYDSDPLASIIGPMPPPKVQARGRGALTASTMDARFDPNYDPKVDVNLDPDEEADDWDMALEALRDRAKWRKTGADRLRAAGFTEEEVAHFETGGGGRRGDAEAEKDISNVKWAKKGEGREWDRGKVDDGERLDIKPEWAEYGRLKGT